jgi:hypothetical protein
MTGSPWSIRRPAVPDAVLEVLEPATEAVLQEIPIFYATS